MKNLHFEGLVTGPILRPLFPSLKKLTAVKGRLAQFFIDAIVQTAQPELKFLTCVSPRRILRDVCSQVLCTDLARIELCKEAHESAHILLVNLRRSFREAGGHGMQ